MGIPAPLAFAPTAIRNVAAGLVVGNPVGSSGTRAKALTSAELKAIVEASGISYLPLSGGTLTGPITGTSGLIEQRNGLTSQCLDIFETYTSGTNNGKMRIKASSSGHQIGSARATSGSNRTVFIGHSDGSDVFTSGLSVPVTGNIVIGAPGTERNIEFYNAAGSPYLGKFSNAGINIFNSSGGNGTARSGRVWVDDTGYVFFNSRGMLTSSANGVLHVQNFSFDDLVSQVISFGPATSASNGMRLKRAFGTQVLAVRNGNDSADGDITCGNLTASGTTKIILPTSDPHIVGCLWNNSGTITISAG